MKKQTLLLIAGSMLTLAACNNPTAPGGFTQEQVDSMVNVRVAELQVAMQASNDSLINVLAQAKADSMIAAMKGGAPASTARTTKPAPKPAAKPTEPAKPAEKAANDVTNKKSAQDAQQNRSVTDRKSAQDAQQNRSVTDRKSKQQ